MKLYANRKKTIVSEENSKNSKTINRERKSAKWPIDKLHFRKPFVVLAFPSDFGEIFSTFCIFSVNLTVSRCSVKLREYSEAVQLQKTLNMDRHIAEKRRLVQEKARAMIVKKVVSQPEELSSPFLYYFE